MVFPPITRPVQCAILRPGPIWVWVPIQQRHRWRINLSHRPAKRLSRRSLHQRPIRYRTMARKPASCRALKGNVQRRPFPLLYLRKSALRFANTATVPVELFDDAPVGYHELDNQGRIVEVNHTELHMLGYLGEEMVGHPVWEFIVEGEISPFGASVKVLIVPTDEERMIAGETKTVLEKKRITEYSKKMEEI